MAIYRVVKMTLGARLPSTMARNSSMQSCGFGRLPKSMGASSLGKLDRGNSRCAL